MTNKDIIFPYYSGNIRLTKVIGYASLSNFIYAQKNPTPCNRKIFEQIKECKDPKEKRMLKHKLYSFTPSVLIKQNEKRKYDNVIRYTGLMQIDLDGIDEIDLAEDLKKWVFEQPECVCSYLSPSNNVKALIAINKPLNQDHYVRLHNAITEKYEETTYFDKATKNAVLPLFLSMDKNILYREYSEAKQWSKEKEIKIDHVALNEQPNFNSFVGNQSFFRNKTVRLLTTKINSISDNGHPQVRSAALILGSRVGANYLSKQDASIIIENLIKQNQYLSKGISGYIETANWAIEQGMNNPRYY